MSFESSINGFTVKWIFLNFATQTNEKGMDAMGDGQEGSWRSQSFRASVRAKIEEAIRQSGNPTTKSVPEMETHVFQKAKSREEYLGFVARLIIHVREMNSKKSIGGGVPQGVPQVMASSSGNVVGQVSDPMSALKSMAGQGSGGTVTIQSQPGQTQMTASLLGSGGTISQMPTSAQAQIQVQSLSPATSGPNVMTSAGMNPMVIQQTRFLGPGAVMGAQPTQQRPQMVPQNMPMMQNFRGQVPPPPNVTSAANPMQGNFNESMFMQSQRSPLSTQFQGHSPAVSVGMAAGPGSNQSGIPSPAGLHPQSIGSQMTPSPSVYGQSPNPQVASSMPGNYLVRTPGVPSPGSALNTPIPTGTTPSPMSRNADEEYMEKRRQLSRFIEPLKQIIANLDKDENKKKDLNRMKNLLDILTDPNKRCPMDVLLKCEQVLERMSSAIIPDGSVSKAAPIPIKSQETDICQSLIDALNNIKKSPMFNQILQKTFLPPLAALFGTSIRDCYPSLQKKRKYEEEPPEITDVLQGEIARLDQKFKVQFDPVQHMGSRIVSLICQLDDKNLPCVPSITITVPDNYPECPPQCNVAKEEYESTPILMNIQKVFCTRISTMPQKYSITSLLDMWEMSVRQACASKPVIDESDSGAAK